MKEDRTVTRLSKLRTVEFMPGIFRTTMSYNENSMLCHFRLTRGASIKLHHHAAVQNGYVIKGKVRFLKEGGKSFIVGNGDGYIFGSNEPHGSEVLEDTELIECFTPMRPEYVDE